MLENKHWIDRNLRSIGLVMFIIGMILLTLETAFALIEVATGNVQWNFMDSSLGLPMRILYVASMHYVLGALLVGLGVALYCVSKFLDMSIITIVGFERTPPSELIVRGPDEHNVIWIGKAYKNAVDAELAKQAFSQRIGSG
jgi:hypothetical protein